MRRTFSALILAVIILSGFTISISEAALNMTDNGVAIGGYDPVAFFTQNEAVKGDPRIRIRTKDDVFWLFTTEAHRELFLENPDKYTPQYGGFCAFAMGYRVKAVGNPRIFTVYKDKLYLNQTEKVQKRWYRQQDVLIDLADKYWPAFK